MTDFTAYLRLGVDSRDAVTAQKDLDRMAKSGDTADKSFSRLSSTSKILGASIGGIGLAQATSSIIAYSDAWTNVENVLSGVSDSQTALASTQAKIISLSKETFSSLDATAGLYAEITRAVSDLGINQDRVIGVTRTLNNLFLAGGKSAQEASGAIRQLNQGLASGALRGDEFNSVAEGAPRILDALSAKLNITKGELRDFAATGGITAELLIRALEDYSSEAQNAVDTTTRTFSQNAELARTFALEFIGASDAVADFSSTAGSALLAVAQNLDVVGDAATAVAVVIGARMVSAFGAATAAKIESIAASKASAIADNEAALGAERRALAEAASAKASLDAARAETAASVASVKASLASDAARLETLKIIAAEIQAERVLENQRIKSQYTAKGRDLAIQRATALGVDHANVLNQIALAEQRLATSTVATSNAVVSSRARETAATEAYAAATLQASATSANLARTNAAVAATGALATATRGLTAAVGLLGGPAGVAIIAGTALYFLATSSTDAEKTLVELEATSASATTRLNEMAASAQAVAKLDLTAKLEGLVELRDELAQSIGPNSFFSEEYLIRTTEKIRLLDGEIDKTKKGLGELSDTANTAASSFSSYVIDLEALTESTGESLKENLGLYDETQAKIKAAADRAKEFLDIVERAEIDELFSFAENPFDIISDGSDEAAKSITETIKALEQERLALEIGEVAYLAYSLAIKGASEEEIRSAVAIKQRSIELRKGAKESETYAESFGDAFNDIFSNIIDGSDTVFESVAKGFKALLITMAKEAIVTPIVLNLQQQMGGSSGSSSANNASSATGAFSAGGIWGLVAIAAVAASQEYNKTQEEKFAALTAEVRQGSQSIGTILGSANQKSESINNSITELSKYADDSLGVNRGMLQALLDIRSGIAGVAAGFARTITGLGNTNIRTGTGTMIDPRLVSGEAGIAEIYSRREDFSLLAKAGLNDPITDFVSNFLGALGNKVTSELFKKSTKIIDSGIVIPAGQLLSDIMANGTIEAFAYADVQTKKKVLGLTTSNKVKTQTEALNDVLLGQFADVFSSAGSALEQAADVFGLDFDKYINRLIIDPQKLSLKDLEGDALTKEIENFFSSTLDNWAGVLVGGTEILNQFQQVGEGAFETVIRLAGELNVFNSYADALNLNFTASGFAAVTASQNIAELAGGFDKLNSSLSGYYQNFFTEEERAERQMSLLATELSKLGVDSVPTSREAFRALIEGIDLTTEAGQKQFAGLLNLQAVFAELVPATKDAADAVESAADAMSRLKSAAQDSFSVLENLVNAERDRIEAIVSGATSAKSALDAALSAERDSITSAHNERLSQLETLAAAERDEAQRRANAQNEANKALARARIESINDERSAVEDRIGGLRSLFDELSGTVDDLAIQSADLNRTRRRQAEFEVDTALANARAGRGLPVDGKLSEALAVLRDNPASLYRTAEEMAYATAVLQNKIGDLAGLTEDQLSYEERSLSSLDKQLAAAESAADSLAKVYAVTTTSYDALIAQEKEQYTASLASLDIIAKNAQDQYDLLTGINTKTLSVEDALNKFNESLLAADFDNAQEQYKRLDDILDAGRSQLDELININNGIKDIPAAIEALAKQLEALREEQRIQALTQQKTLNETARNTRILANNEEAPV